jgi:SNF2 family DNA or RNA helicase
MFELDKSYKGVFSWLLRLRQCAIAPYIISCEAKRNTSEKYIDNFGLDKIEHGIKAPKIVETLKIIDSIIVNKKVDTLYELAHNKLVHMNDKTFFQMRTTLAVRALPQPEKIIIFSNFVSALDLLTSMLDKLPNFKYVQLDGESKDREQILNSFKYSTDVNCMLTSYKVGSTGFNLTEATHCIFLEPWWNNATLNQAKARLWRIGQTKPVIIYNLIAEDTIEEHVIKICNKKDDMIKSYFEGKNCNVSCTLTRQVVHDILYN